VHGHDDVNHFDPASPLFSCPNCGYAFECGFVKNDAYRAAREDWLRAGLGHLLR
jgi:hypothetical protein